MPQTITPLRYPGGLSRAQVVAWRNGLFLVFALCGLAIASWVSRLPSVRDALRADTQQMGILLFGIAAGSIVGLLLSSHLIARFGTRVTISVVLVLGALGFGTAGIGVTVSPNFELTFAGLLVFGACFSICDVSINVLGAANERVLGRAIMPIFHAFFSFGTMVGAGLGVLAEHAGLPIAGHIGGVAIVFAVGGLLAVRLCQSELMVEDVAESTAGASRPGASDWRSRLAIWKDPRTLLIGLIVLGMAFSEGSANDWVSLATVDGHSTEKATGALVFGIFVTAMTCGRLAGVGLLDRFGRVPVLRVSAVFAAVGLLVFIFVPVLWIAVVGVAFWGLGSALGFPVGMSAAADDPRTAAARVSAVATIGYFAFLVGPPLIGFLGQHFGLLHGLLVVLALVALAGVVSAAATPPVVGSALPRAHLPKR